MNSKRYGESLGNRWGIDQGEDSFNYKENKWIPLGLTKEQRQWHEIRNLNDDNRMLYESRSRIVQICSFREMRSSSFVTSQQIDLSGAPFYKIIPKMLYDNNTVLLIQKSLYLSLKFRFLIGDNDLSPFSSETLIIKPLLQINSSHIPCNGPFICYSANENDFIGKHWLKTNKPCFKISPRITKGQRYVSTFIDCLTINLMNQLYGSKCSVHAWKPQRSFPAWRAHGFQHEHRNRSSSDGPQWCRQWSASSRHQ